MPVFIDLTEGGTPWFPAGLFHLKEGSHKPDIGEKKNTRKTQ